MYCVLLRNASVTAIMVFSCLSVLLIEASSCGGEKYMEQCTLELNAADEETDDEHLASNDFSLNHRNGKDESLQHGPVTTLRSENLLRACIYDREKILILTQTLIWFTHSTYRASLPSLWCPSIIIAHRRLII